MNVVVICVLEARLPESNGFKNYVLDPHDKQKTPWANEKAMAKCTAFLKENKSVHNLYVVSSEAMDGYELFKNDSKLSFKIWFC